MQRATTNFEAANDSRTISDLRDDLRDLASRRLRGKDAETIRIAIQRLDFLDELSGDLKTLRDELAEIEKEHESDLVRFPDQIGKADLGASIFALDAVYRFLLARAPCHNLMLLRGALVEIVIGGSPAAMFHPEDHPKGRRQDVPTVMATKGILAGMMHVQQSTGLSREEAAKWIVEHVSPSLVARISRKPLTARAVTEWLDRYGGKFAEPNAGRKSYLVWSRGEPVSPKKFREITERVAKILLGRKHK
jgi:hypothetical protein